MKHFYLGFFIRPKAFKIEICCDEVWRPLKEPAWIIFILRSLFLSTSLILLSIISKFYTSVSNNEENYVIIFHQLLKLN